MAAEKNNRSIAELEIELADHKKRIEQLERELIEAKKCIDQIIANKSRGRMPQNEKWMIEYNKFVQLYESGVSIAEMVDLKEHSRSTLYRYKAYYDKHIGKK